MRTVLWMSRSADPVERVNQGILKPQRQVEVNRGASGRVAQTLPAVVLRSMCAGMILEITEMISFVERVCAKS